MCYLRSKDKSFRLRRSAPDFCTFSTLIARHSPLSLFFSALPYKIGVTPLPVAFTHFDRCGRVRTYFSRHSSLATRHSPPQFVAVFCSLLQIFAAYRPLVLFLFNSLQTLFCKSGGGPANGYWDRLQSATCRHFSAFNFQLSTCSRSYCGYWRMLVTRSPMKRTNTVFAGGWP